MCRGPRTSSDRNETYRRLQDVSGNHARRTSSKSNSVVSSAGVRICPWIEDIPLSRKPNNQIRIETLELEKDYHTFMIAAREVFILTRLFESQTETTAMWFLGQGKSP